MNSYPHILELLAQTVGLSLTRCHSASLPKLRKITDGLSAKILGFEDLRFETQLYGTDLRTNLEVILLIIPVDVPLLACARAPASWDGEAGGPL